MPVDIILSRLHPPFLWQDFPHYPSIKTHAGHLINSGAFKKPPWLRGARIRKGAGRGGVGLFCCCMIYPPGVRCPFKSRVPSPSNTRVPSSKADGQTCCRPAGLHLHSTGSRSHHAILFFVLLCQDSISNQNPAMLTAFMCNKATTGEKIRDWETPGWKT